MRTRFYRIDDKLAWVLELGIVDLFHWSTGRFTLFLNLPTVGVWIEKLQIKCTFNWSYVLWKKQIKKFSYEWITGKLPCPPIKERVYKLRRN